jgi:hypothetical protein
MQTITVTGESNISYKVLKDYHSTAHALYDYLLQDNQPVEVDYVFDIDIEANDIEEAKKVFMDYLKRLNNLGVINHSGHLVYITQNIIDNEGSYISEEAILNDKVLPHLESLQRLLTIQNKNEYGNLRFEIGSITDGNNDFDYYTRIQDPTVIKEAVATTILTLFGVVKGKSDEYSYDIANTLSKIKGHPTLEEISLLTTKASSVSTKKFKTQLLYTIASTLHRYLNDWSLLNPDKVFITNDQARVIYQTLKIHNLLTVTHEIERDEINYTRMLLTNRIGDLTMLGQITGSINL